MRELARENNSVLKAIEKIGCLSEFRRENSEREAREDGI